MYFITSKKRTTTLLLHPFYSSLDLVRDYPGELVPEPIRILLKPETVSGSGMRKFCDNDCLEMTAQIYPENMLLKYTITGKMFGPRAVRTKLPKTKIVSILCGTLRNGITLLELGQEKEQVQNFIIANSVHDW